MLPSGILSHIGSPISLIKGRQDSFSREGTGAAEATALFRRLEAVVTAAFELCGFGEDKWRESQASLGELALGPAMPEKAARQSASNSQWKWKSSGNICHPAAGRPDGQAGSQAVGAW